MRLRQRASAKRRRRNCKPPEGVLSLTVTLTVRKLDRTVGCHRLQVLAPKRKLTRLARLLVRPTIELVTFDVRWVTRSLNRSIDASNLDSANATKPPVSVSITTYNINNTHEINNSMNTLNQYNTSAGQIAAVGSAATAHNNAFHQIEWPADSTSLIREIEALLEAVRAHSRTLEHARDIASLEAAAKAAAAGDESGILRHLQRVGPWVGKLAGSIGARILTEILVKAGLP